MEDPVVSPDAVIDDAMEGVCPPLRRSQEEPGVNSVTSGDDAVEGDCPSSSAESGFSVITIPVEFTPGDSDSGPADESLDSPRRRRRKRKWKCGSGRFSLESALSSPSGSLSVVPMDDDYREHTTAKFFGTYKDIWKDTVTFEYVRADCFYDWSRAPDDSSPG